MTHLPHNWLTEGWIDFEYKKYLLLAYLQKVTGNFEQHRLFPDLPELRTHYQNATQLKASKEEIQAAFPKKLLGIHPEKKQLVYEKMQESASLAEIDSILAYALPLFQQTLAQGQARATDIEAQLTFAPVGIVPLQTHEGYLFIYRARVAETDIYQYRIKLFDNQVQRIVDTTYLQTIRKNLSTTFEGIKLTLLRQRRDLPNPATYLIESPRDYPLHETLLPLAKKLIAKYVVTE
jgi:hypothetical protein